MKLAEHELHDLSELTTLKKANYKMTVKIGNMYQVALEDQQRVSQLFS